jgi:hypothetical protein
VLAIFYIVITFLSGHTTPLISEEPANFGWLESSSPDTGDLRERVAVDQRDGDHGEHREQWCGDGHRRRDDWFGRSVQHESDSRRPRHGV